MKPIKLIQQFLILNIGILGIAGLDQAILQPETNKKVCLMEKVQRMLGYSCSGLNLKEIPQYLKSSAEILDISFNRIRDLDKASLNRYTDVKYLYLFDNMIQTIEIGTFAILTKLEALDLSDNALTTIPLEIFHLPVLRNFYVANNNLFHLEDDLMNLRTPIKAPLQIISLASCKLHTVPRMGILPDLLHLNLSSNPLSNADPNQIDPMCSLKTIDLSNTKILPCYCQSLKKYFYNRTIIIKGGNWNCDAGVNCQLMTVETEEFNQCITAKQMRIIELKESNTWMIVGVSSGAATIIILIIICIVCKRKRNRARKRKKAKTLSKETNKLVLNDIKQQVYKNEQSL